MNHMFTTFMMKYVLASVALLLVTVASTTQAAEESLAFDGTVQPFFKKYCRAVRHNILQFSARVLAT